MTIASGPQGQIKHDVKTQHLRIYTGEEDVLKAVTQHFDVNYGRRIQAAGTALSAYLIEPDKFMLHSFGFSDELLLVLSDFGDLQPRTMQAIEQIYSEQPFKARANPLAYLIVSKAESVVEFVTAYLVDHPQSRTPIPVHWQEIESKDRDKWYLRNKLSATLFARDLFDYQLPLDEDLYFFGRTNIVNDLVDSVRKSQNRGVFGLRKTGKTSILYKLARICRDNNVARVLYFDCKRPDIRSKRGLGLLGLITDAIIKELSLPRTIGINDGMIERFLMVVRAIPQTEKICVVFDEIEYISPLAKLDTHWERDFIDFWQFLWSIQSEVRRISYVVAGVNPYLVELDLINGIQNPVFGIVKPSMITGMNKEDVHTMVKRIGKQMGLDFDDVALDYLYNRYGGHPLLTRMACSYTNSKILEKVHSRPFKIGATFLRNMEQERDSELQFYCRHIVSELDVFYKDEYDMLEMLARGNTADFMELGVEPQWVMHLKGYGIITVNSKGRPAIQLPVLQRYIAADAARKDGSRDLRAVVPPDKRKTWLEIRKAAILRDFKALLKIVAEKAVFQPYRGIFIPEADRFSSIAVASDWPIFREFINKTFQTFCETIDKLHPKGAFFKELKAEFPDLFYALNRIRVLRNEVDHIMLNKDTQSAFERYREEDLYGRTLSQIQEPWFVLQQIALDELFVALQCELTSHS